METKVFRDDHFRTRFSADWSSAGGRALIASGLWMRAGFIGASALVCGLLVMFRGEGRLAVAVSLALGGALVAVLAWRRATTILARIDMDKSPVEVVAQTKRPAAGEATARSRRQPRLAA